MQPLEHVLVLGPSSGRLALLAERMRDLGHSTFHAEGPDDARELLGRDAVSIKMALVDASLAADGRIDLDALAPHTLRDRVIGVGVGERPGGRARQRLRAAGVELALWEPSGDHALRFQTNRALASSQETRGLAGMRSETRVPTDWHADVTTGGREKRASVYSLSSAGAFLATPRPSPCGATIGVELPLPSGRIRLEGLVLYTNVPGNVRETALPDGMAIRFTDGDPAMRRHLRYNVAAVASRLLV